MAAEHYPVTIEIPYRLSQEIKMLASDLGVSRTELIERAVSVLIQARKVTREHEVDRNKKLGL